jgi:hypothetical protein
MLPQDPFASGVWQLLEELYLDSANKRVASEYAGLSEAEKQTTLLAFANTQAAVSKRWAAIVVDLRSVGLKIEDAAKRSPVTPDDHHRPLEPTDGRGQLDVHNPASDQSR